MATVLRTEVGDGSVFLNLLCFRYQKNSILELRQFLGDAKLLEIFELFAGLYVRFPTASNTILTAQEVQLALHYRDLRSKRASRDMIKWNDAETRFIRLARSLGYTYDRAVVRSKALLKEIELANTWLGSMKTWDNKKREEII